MGKKPDHTDLFVSVIEFLLDPPSLEWFLIAVAVLLLLWPVLLWLHGRRKNRSAG